MNEVKLPPFSFPGAPLEITSAWEPTRLIPAPLKVRMFLYPNIPLFSRDQVKCHFIYKDAPDFPTWKKPSYSKTQYLTISPKSVLHPLPQITFICVFAFSRELYRPIPVFTPQFLG